MQRLLSHPPAPATITESAPLPTSDAWARVRTLADFGALLEQIRRSQHLSLRQASLAARGTPSHVTIRDWEKGVRLPRRSHLFDLLTHTYGYTPADAQACLDALTHLSAPDTPPTSAVVLHGRPPSLAAAYQPRQRVRDAIAEQWRSPQCSSVTMVALHGPGGVGKTQIAAGVLLAESDPARLRIWIDASNRETVISTLAYAGQHSLDVHGAPTDTPAQWAQHFLHWLAHTSTPWLIVLDNLVDWGVLDPQTSPTSCPTGDPADASLWPAGCGRVLITTRYRGPRIHSMGVRGVAVPTFTSEEALSFLSTRLSPRLVGEDTLPAHALDAADELCAYVHHFPLALAHAGASIEAMGLTCADYLTSVRGSVPAHRQAHWQDDDLSTHYIGAVGSTWRLAANVAQAKHPKGLSLPVLYLASVIDPLGMPVDFWCSAAAIDYLARHSGHPAASITRDDIVLALRLLHQLCLVSHRHDDSPRAVTIHAFTQCPVRASLASVPSAHTTPLPTPYGCLLDETVAVAARSLAQIWPQRLLTSELGVRLRANVVALWKHQSPAISPDDVYGAFYLFGASLLSEGRYPQAQRAFYELTKWAQVLRGPDRPSTKIYELYEVCARGWSGEFIAAYHDLMDLHPTLVACFGPHHRETLWCQVNAALFLFSSGRPVEAESLMRQASETLSRWLPNDSLRYMARYWSALFALTLRYTPEAEQTFLAAQLEATTRCSPDDPVTLLSREAHFGGILIPPPCAESFMQRYRSPAAAREHIESADVPSTLTNLHKAAFVARTSGYFRQAREILELLLPVMVGHLGDHHADVLWCRLDAAETLRELGEYATALAELRELLPLLHDVLGKDHSRTLWCRGEMARCYLGLGDAERAEEELRELIPALDTLRGTLHPDTLVRRQHLAHALLEQQREQEAVVVLRGVVEDMTTSRGSRHPRTEELRALMHSLREHQCHS